MAYNMEKDGWEIFKKVFSLMPKKSILSLMPSNLSHQLLQASLLLSFVMVWSFESDSLPEGPAFHGGFLLQHATAESGRSVGSGFPGNEDKRAVAPCFTATCLPTSARHVEESQH